MSLNPLNLVKTTFARFLVALSGAGLASIAGAIEKRSHVSGLDRFHMIFRRILISTAVHVAREALGTLRRPR